MMKDFVRGCSRIIGLVALLSLLCSCLDRIVEKPTFILKDASLTLHDMAVLKALLTVEVQNPNRFSLQFQSLEYRFFLDGRESAKGKYAEPFEVPPSSTEEVAIPLTIGFNDLGSHLKKVIKGKDIPYRIEGTLQLKALWGSLAIPFNKKGTLHVKL